VLKVKFKFNEEAIVRVRTRMVNRANQAKPFRISAGIHEEEGAVAAMNYKGEAGPATLMMVAMWNEYGTGRNPARPFIRSWFDANIGRMRAEGTAAMRAEFKGEAGAMEEVAEKWTEELREWVRGNEGELAELMPATQVARAREGLSPAPPIDAQGQIVDALRAILETP